MGKTTARVLVFDAGPLIAIERASSKMTALLERCRDARARILVPAPVLSQVWRDGKKQARLSSFLKLPGVEVVPMDSNYAKASGVLCGLFGTQDPIDACVVVLAKRWEAIAVTSDLDDLTKLNASLKLIAV